MQGRTASVPTNGCINGAWARETRIHLVEREIFAMPSLPGAMRMNAGFRAACSKRRFSFPDASRVAAGRMRGIACVWRFLRTASNARRA